MSQHPARKETLAWGRHLVGPTMMGTLKEVQGTRLGFLGPRLGTVEVFCQVVGTDSGEETLREKAPKNQKKGAPPLVQRTPSDHTEAAKLATLSNSF